MRTNLKFSLVQQQKLGPSNFLLYPITYIHTYIPTDIRITCMVLKLKYDTSNSLLYEAYTSIRFFHPRSMSNLLHKLPHDVLLSCLLPYMQRQSVDDWTQLLFEWVSPRLRIPIYHLAEYKNNGSLIHNEQWAAVCVCSTPLRAFSILGPYSVPYSIYSQLDVRSSNDAEEENASTPLKRWLEDMSRRQVVQSRSGV